MLCFTKYCDALNLEFFIKTLSSNLPDHLINTLNIVILADILLTVITDILLAEDDFLTEIKLYKGELLDFLEFLILGTIQLREYKLI